MSQIKSEPLPTNDLPSEIRMQSTIEPHPRQDPRGKSRMPLEVFSQNLLALFDGVVTSATIASAKSGESSDQVIARSLDDTLFELRVWLKSIKRVMPGAESARNSLRTLGKLEGPLTARFRNMLGGIETDLTELSAETTDNTLVFSEQFCATCGRVKASVDQLHMLRRELVEEVTIREGDIRDILNEDSDPANHTLPVVCFDGGGVRSYSSLVIFEALMGEVRSIVEESEGNAIARSIRPCDAFTYMFGSSSGGLVAIMLGRLKMTAEQCKGTFQTYAESIFRRHRLSRYAVFVAGLMTSKYSKKSLVRATKTVVGSFDPSPESQKWERNMFAAETERCRCGVLAYAKPDNTVNEWVPYVFRTYNNTSSDARNPGNAHDCQIWQVALATTAAPSYFPAAKFDSKEYLDGGIGTNNPSREALTELSYLHPKNPICLVSIGSGKRKSLPKFPSRGPGRYCYYLKAAAGFITDTESVHFHMRHLASTSDSFSYFRFNVPGLEDVLLDEWTVKRRKQWRSSGKMHTLEYIERETNMYLAQAETRTMIRTCAEMVVDSYFRSGGSVLVDGRV